MSENDEGPPIEAEPVTVERAQTRGVSHAHEVIHESTRTRVTASAWLVDRSTGVREFSLKIQTEEKKKDDSGFFGWMFADQKSVTLNPEAVHRLVAFARKMGVVAEKNEDGQFIVIRTSDPVAAVANLDPEVVSRAVAGLLQKKEIVDHLAGQELGRELVEAFRGAIRLRELKSALQRLRAMLEEGIAVESAYQEWCSAHWWAFGGAVSEPDSIRQIALGDQVDLLVPSSLTGLRDVIELKRPDKDVISFDSTHRNWFWSRDASQAIGQCHRYLDALHETAGRGLRDHPEIVAHFPRATVVIGRSKEWTAEHHRALHGLNGRLNGIQLMTYDQLLRQGERIIESVSARREEVQSSPSVDEDSPF